MAAQRMMTCCRLHEVPQTGDIGEHDPKRGKSQLLRALGFGYIDSDIGFVSFKPASFSWRAGGAGGDRGVPLLREKNGFLLGQLG